jgi:uncharacterized membrane protein YhfC
MIELTYALDSFLMIAMPVGLAIFLTRRWKHMGRIWWIGALTFVFSQVGHIPFNALITPVFNRSDLLALHPSVQLFLQALFYGLSAGIFEEGARYLVLRFWLKDARSWRAGVLFGAGHGGAEAVIFGVLVLYTLLRLLAVRDLTPEQLAQTVGPDNVALAQTQITAFWTAPWHMIMLGALERLFTIPCQIAMAVLVMQVFIRKQIGWLFAAIGYHALIDGVAVFGVSRLNVYEIEAIIGGFAILSVVIIFILRRSEPQPVVAPVPAFQQPTVVIKSIEDTKDNLDNSRYQS